MQERTAPVMVSENEAAAIILAGCFARWAAVPPASSRRWGICRSASCAGTSAAVAYAGGMVYEAGKCVRCGDPREPAFGIDYASGPSRSVMRRLDTMRGPR